MSMQGKTVLITGATDGIGKETARALAGQGATVVIVGRSPEKGARVLAELKQSTGNPNIELLLADLSSMKEVRALATAFKAKHDRLDVLVNNAGAIYTERQVTVDGYERTFATNHLAYFLLTNLLLDLLKKSAPARIVNVSSEAHKSGKLDFDDLQSEKSYTTFTVYGTSKLANVLFTYELARRLAGTGVTANCLHPGVISSGFGNSTNRLLRIGFALVRPFMIDAVKGAQTSIYVASSPDVAGVSGKYFKNKRPYPSRKLTQNEALAKRLWDVSERLTSIQTLPTP